jgi:hypothetical protein
VPAIILLLLAFFWPVQSTPSDYNEAEAYEVYAAVLPSEWPIRDTHAKRVVIRRETKAFQMCLKPDIEIQPKVEPAIADYVRLNEREWLLQPRISLDRPYEFFGARKFEALMRGAGMGDDYYRLYPDSGGLIELSAVGFNSDKTVAVVYIGHGCGPLCGGGTFHVLEKIDGKWKSIEWKGGSCAWAA